MGPEAACTSWGWCPTAASIPAGSTSKRAWSSPPGRACRTWSSTPSRTDVTQRRSPAPGTSPSSSDGSSTRAGSGQWAGASTRWTGTAAVSGVEESYERGETDEFVRPTVIGDYDGMADGDAVLHFNFRPDRARELTRALGEPDFDEFPRGAAPQIRLTTLTEYQQGLDYPVAFPPKVPEVTLAQ